MIDVENMVVDKVYRAVKDQFPKADVASEYVDVPSAFPHVSIWEDDNYTYTGSQDDKLSENHTRVMYLVNVYSNKKNGKKAEAKAIMEVVDNTLQELKFTRTLKQPIPNQDKTIYRIVGRYEAVIREGQDIDGDTIYQVYRR